MAGPDSNDQEPNAVLLLEMTEKQVHGSCHDKTKPQSSHGLAHFSCVDVACTLISVAKPVWKKHVVSFGSCARSCIKCSFWVVAHTSSGCRYWAGQSLSSHGKPSYVVLSSSFKELIMNKYTCLVKPSWQLQFLHRVSLLHVFTQ